MTRSSRATRSPAEAIRSPRVARAASARAFHTVQVERRSSSPSTTRAPSRSTVAGLTWSCRSTVPGRCAQCVGGDGGRVAAGDPAGPVGPAGQQLLQRVGGLRRAGGQGGLLPQPHHLDPAGRSGMRGGEVGHGGAQRRVDVSRAGGERGEQPVVQPLDLERGGAALPAGPPPPPDRQPAGEVVGEQVVIQLGHGDGGVVQRPGVHRPPPAVRSLDLVRDHDVGVQVRVAGAGVPVVERRRQHPPRGHLRGPAGAGAGPQRGRFAGRPGCRRRRRGAPAPPPAASRGRRGPTARWRTSAR